MLTIVMLLVGSLIVGALASYAVATLRSMPTARSRTTRVEAVKSAVRMAMTLQRDAGPNACYTALTSYTIDGLPVTVTCSSLDSYSTGADRYGVITTANTSNVASLTGRAGGSAFVKRLDGKVLLNAGLLSGTTDVNPYNTSIEMSRYQDGSTPQARYQVNSVSAATGCDTPAIGASDAYPKTPGTHSLTCTDGAWWTMAGDVTASSRQYPLLPQIPTSARDSSLATIASCKIFYPGRYLTGGTLTLTGTNYFASGLYYFERPISIAAGATVVIGEGRFPGCVFDNDAAFAPTAPKTHEITGKGATLLLGAGANITVAGGAKLTINRRVSSPTSRGTEGQSIHAVSFGVNSAAVVIPADQVKLADGSLQLASVHQVPIGTTGQKAKYTASTLTPASTALQIDLAAGSDIVIDGYIVTPQSKVVVNGNAGVTAYGLRCYGGLIASNVAVNVANAPSDATKWYFGMKAEVIQRRFALTASALVNGHTVTSKSAFELNQDKSYAINYWTVDA